jgi:hypothetical protein
VYTYDVSFGGEARVLSVFLLDDFLELLVVPGVHRVQLVLPHITVQAPLLGLPLDSQVVRKLTLVTLRTLTLLEKRTQDRLRVRACEFEGFLK